MAALIPGISYELSHNNGDNANKEVLFVKLSDDAYRAIKDYQKNENKISSHATIQFLRNEGRVSLPSVSNNGDEKFTFSISESEGNCIQQNNNQLNVVGSLTNKLTVHPKTYVATAHKMAVSDESKQNKFTREIRPNKTDIGRKVLVRHDSQSSKNNKVPRKKRNNRERPMAQRMIQLLALRPHKKIEVLAKIRSDGITNIDKKSKINDCLLSVANFKNNAYDLKPHMWNEVQEEWPFYSQEERKTIERRKAENLIPPTSLKEAIKQPSLNKDEHFAEIDPPTKKKRISHCKKDFVNYLKSSGTCDNVKLIKRDSKDSSPAVVPSKRKRINHYKNDLVNLKTSVKCDNLKLLNFNHPAVESDDNVAGLNLNVSSSERDSQSAKRISSTPPLMSDHNQEKENAGEQTWIKKQINEKVKIAQRQHVFGEFTKITSIDQRRLYKQVFENEFDEYKKLFESLERVTERFTDLQSQLREVSNSAEMATHIHRQIVDEFQRSTTGSAQSIYVRFHYLWQKLSHIQNLIKIYDKSISHFGL